MNLPLGQGIGYTWRFAAMIVAGGALLLAILGSDGTLEDIGSIAFGDLDSRSEALDDVRTWVRVGLVAIAALLLLTRGLWADVLVVVSIGLVVAAVGGLLTETTKAKPKRVDFDVDPPSVTRGAARFSIPANKVRPPGSDLALARKLVTPGRKAVGQSTLPVSVILVVPIRDEDRRVLRQESHAHDGWLAATVKADGPKKAVPVDVKTDKEGFASDLTAARHVYLLRRQP